MYVELTVGDHLANGFVNLARWPIPSVAEGHRLLDAIDGAVPAEAAGDPKGDDYTFILDLHEGDENMIGNSQKCLPLQLARRLAPDQVDAWLRTRPDPDSVAHIWPPVLAGSPSLTD